MAQLSITINGRNYSIACEDGQEDHLGRLAEYLDHRVTELASSIGQVGDSKLLLMAGLLIADELSDAYAELSSAKGERRPASKGRLWGQQDPNAPDPAAEQAEQAAIAIELLAKHIEQVAARLEDA